MYVPYCNSIHSYSATDEFSITFTYGIYVEESICENSICDICDFEPADHDIFIYEVYYKNSNAGFVFRNAASEKKVVYNSPVLMPSINMPFYIFLQREHLKKETLHQRNHRCSYNFYLSSGIKSSEVTRRNCLSWYMIFKIASEYFWKRNVQCLFQSFYSLLSF